MPPPAEEAEPPRPQRAKSPSKPRSPPRPPSTQRKSPPPSPPAIRRTTPAARGSSGSGTPSAGGSNGPLLGGTDCPDAQKLLDAANRFRATHSAPPLEWSTRLASDSQAYAEELAKKSCKLEHDSYGENLMRVSSVPAPDKSCAGAINAWYGEVNWYDFTTPNAFRENWSNNVGHFTQLVWKGSSQIGCGVATAEERTVFPSGKVFMGGCKVIVCRFNPYGNVASDAAFRANVLPATSG
ncbi:hypothetical protein HYH03_007805 [Edaphochlamys debaryana]|uniref:SCP domain-containing protein n=1 Tax=Edaphochlamys debaryana TaxID=47281 RepID=A0A836BYT4_9CHLO|nr:hypothetical protein HYH03_007805 [Edaphochlamys debaryana]|eukprot:KAG2494171.1 hypothetical protein HYH03_007805 [Edaphochlamys debaryana]